MTHLARFAAVTALLTSLLFPLSAYAITPMGGLVTFVRPCNTGYLVTVINAGGIGSGEFMWTPGSIIFPYGPPVIHTWVLGMTDIPIPCFIGPVLYGWGQRITFSGASLPAPMGSESAGVNSVINAHGLY